MKDTHTRYIVKRGVLYVTRFGSTMIHTTKDFDFARVYTSLEDAEWDMGSSHVTPLYRIVKIRIKELL